MACKHRGQIVELGFGQHNARRAGVFVEARHPPRAGDRHDVRAAMQQPRQRQLCRRTTARLRQGQMLAQLPIAFLELIAE